MVVGDDKKKKQPANRLLDHAGAPTVTLSTQRCNSKTTILCSFVESYHDNVVDAGICLGASRTYMFVPKAPSLHDRPLLTLAVGLYVPPGEGCLLWIVLLLILLLIWYCCRARSYYYHRATAVVVGLRSVLSSTATKNKEKRKRGGARLKKIVHLSN